MTGFDWLALLQAGVQGLRMRPEDFWKLTPAELRLMLGQSGSAPAMTRSGLDALLAVYPDQHKGECNE